MKITEISKIWNTHKIKAKTEKNRKRNNKICNITKKSNSDQLLDFEFKFFNQIVSLTLKHQTNKITLVTKWVELTHVLYLACGLVPFQRFLSQC